MLTTARRVTARRTGTALAALALVAGAGAAPALAEGAAGPLAAEDQPATHPFPAKDDLNGRRNIGDPADAPDAVVDAYKAGDSVPVQCQQEHDGAIWDLTADQLWVPDQYVKTGADGFADGVPRCDGGGDQPADTVPGIDVSNNNKGPVDFSRQSFAYMKATEGTSFVDDTREAYTTQARDAGAATGAYHFAWPSGKSGSQQADYFIEHGGGWTNDGRTLPGAIDLEDYEGEPHCYGVDPEQMVAFIDDFSNRYEERTGRKPVIYTTASWWNDCTGSSTAFGDHPLWIANYHDDPSDPGALPAGWSTWAIYQYTEKPLDKNVLAGGENGLEKLATG